MAVEMGYADVMVYSKGILGWARAGYPLTRSVHYPEIQVPLLSSADLSSIERSTSILVDIRPESHFRKGHVEGSIHIDLEDLHEQLDALPADKKIVLIDHKGKLTLTTGRFLAMNGYKDLARLDGGFNAWVKHGLPVSK